MDIDDEHLAIPDTSYDAVIKMPAGEFQRVCRDLAQIGESVVITCNKDGIKFSSSGDLGKGNITIRPSDEADVDEKDEVVITLQKTVQLTFALQFLNLFTKATA